MACMRLTAFLRDRSATTAIEYALIASGVALAVLAVITQGIGGGLNTMFSNLMSGFK